MKQKIYNVSWSQVLGFLLLFTMLFSEISLYKSNQNRSSLEGYDTITYEKYDFSIDYPKKWQVATYGDKGKWYDDTIKLELYITERNPFGIFIRHQPAISPTLQNVSDWGTVVMSRIQTRKNIVEFPDVIQGQPVIRQRYNWGSSTTESVYIARSSDMIIISMQVKQYDYHANLDDFNAIVASFHPFE